MLNYKQLSEELYDALVRARNLFDDANGDPINRYGATMSSVDAVIQKYEDATTKGTGRTTALYMKAIAEALAKPGENIEFVDHSPIDFTNALTHQNALRSIIARLGYNIEVWVQHSMANLHNKVTLVNRFER